MRNLNTALKVLYVEDDPDIQVIARIALEDIGGLDVRACMSGSEAIAALDGFTPDLLLLDVMMQGMDGPTLLEHLRAGVNVVTAPVIFMTARVQASEKGHYLSLGAIDVISKPFDPLTLASRITQALKGVR